MRVYCITYQRPVPWLKLIHVSGKILANRDCEAYLKITAKRGFLPGQLRSKNGWQTGENGVMYALAQ
jgi:hypothetical protein